MSLAEAHVERAVEYLRAGRGQSPTPIDHLPADCRPKNVEDALLIQDRLHEVLTGDGLGSVVGTKIGCTTPVMQEFLGMTHPCAGAIFQTTVRHREGEFDFKSFLHVGVECEIAATLNRPILAAQAPHTLESVSASVAALHAAIEVVDDRYVDFVARIPDWRTWVADDFFGAGIVLGEPVTSWRDIDLPQVRGVMQINQTEVGFGHGRDIINGHPLEALAWLANAEAARGRDLPTNWIVMLGSVVQTKWVAEGDVVDVDIAGLGRARAIFQ